MLACSDDSSSAGSNGWHMISNKPVEIAMGECSEDKDAVAGEAQLDCECDKCVVKLSNVDDYCGVTASVEYRVFRDTLHVRYADVTETSKCMCVSDHSLEVGSVDWQDVEYVTFNGRVDFIGSASYNCKGSTGQTIRTHVSHVRPVVNVKQ